MPQRCVNSGLQRPALLVWLQAQVASGEVTHPILPTSCCCCCFPAPPSVAGNHGAMSTHPIVNILLGLTDDLIGGSSLMWRYHHQVRLGFDPCLFWKGKAPRLQVYQKIQIQAHKPLPPLHVLNDHWAARVR
jgi:hypothetical protein